MSREVNKGVNAILPFRIKDGNGSLANADSTPTNTRVMVNGVDTTVAGVTVSQQQDQTPANITGHYQVLVPTAGFTSDDFIEIQVQAVVGGFTVDHELSFTVIERLAGRPVIESN